MASDGFKAQIKLEETSDTVSLIIRSDDGEFALETPLVRIDFKVTRDDLTATFSQLVDEATIQALIHALTSAIDASKALGGDGDVAPISA